MSSTQEQDELAIAKLIADLGAAGETELQARTLKPLTELREEIHHLEDRGLVRRHAGGFKGAYGDALELTPKGYKLVRASPKTSV